MVVSLRLELLVVVVGGVRREGLGRCMVGEGMLLLLLLLRLQKGRHVSNVLVVVVLGTDALHTAVAAPVIAAHGRSCQGPCLPDSARGVVKPVARVQRRLLLLLLLLIW